MCKQTNKARKPPLGTSLKPRPTSHTHSLNVPERLSKPSPHSTSLLLCVTRWASPTKRIRVLILLPFQSGWQTTGMCKQILHIFLWMGGVSSQSLGKQLMSSVTHDKNVRFQNNLGVGWDGSVTKSTGCPSRGPRFNSYHHNLLELLSSRRFQKICPFSDVCGHIMHMVHTGKTNTQTQKHKR